jgi:hypothetical protein
VSARSTDLVSFLAAAFFVVLAAGFFAFFAADAVRFRLLAADFPAFAFAFVFVLPVQIRQTGI